MFKKHFDKKTNITVDFGAEQYSIKGSEQCSNAYSSFYDNNGHFIIILSDGMGDDDRAAVESKMAVDLIKQYAKQGTDYNLSLKILNSSLLKKSTDESLATVDIVSISLEDEDRRDEIEKRAQEEADTFIDALKKQTKKCN